MAPIIPLAAQIKPARATRPATEAVVVPCASARLTLLEAGRAGQRLDDPFDDFLALLLGNHQVDDRDGQRRERNEREEHAKRNRSRLL